eukprot:TRINITY_DN337_c4_g1_i1.p1 TRINITY_DN337_c4_g1~~TRINITY_DN337_c4_g1_i1.p1  ORF type:complete len:569 (-),score=175.09 TRINITY_DN337_c4_g1_i1:20-1702(-)
MSANGAVESALQNNHKTGKNLKKKKKKKKKKHAQDVKPAQEAQTNVVDDVDDQVEIEYVAAADIQEGDPEFDAFSKIFKRFAPPEELCVVKKDTVDSSNDSTKGSSQAQSLAPEQKENGEMDVEKKPLSKKEKKKQKRLKIAVLKQLVTRPDVVEVHDVNAADPALLVHLKAYRNTVPVPRHWCQKRKYLQGKRGIEKPAFHLPDFIANTGISKIRAAVQEKDDNKKVKEKQRERLQPKMGRMDIDYQVLHDAFFKHQTKPKLTIHGDLYYEGKEFEVKLKEKVPGQLSADLKKALGMSLNGPPPWLINMQRYGPPPSYPNLKIPGLNAPIPPGSNFGYHPGGWGKPPVDEFGRPLYGDVFGTAAPEPPPEVMQPIERKHWGELEEEESESEEEEEREEQEEEEEEGQEQESLPEDQVTSGISSVPSGIETPETIEIRKPKDDKPKQLYQVLEQAESRISTSVYGSSHKYVMPGAAERVDLMKSQKTEKVNVTLNPSDLENTDGLEEILKKKFEEQMEAQKGDTVKEDVSDIIAEEERKRRKRKGKSSDGKNKKYKEFKF